MKTCSEETVTLAKITWMWYAISLSRSLLTLVPWPTHVQPSTRIQVSLSPGCISWPPLHSAGVNSPSPVIFHCTPMVTLTNLYCMYNHWVFSLSPLLDSEFPDSRGCVWLISLSAVPSECLMDGWMGVTIYLFTQSPTGLTNGMDVLL